MLTREECQAIAKRSKPESNGKTFNCADCELDKNIKKYFCIVDKRDGATKFICKTCLDKLNFINRAN